MRRNAIFFVAAIFLCFSAAARGKQASAPPSSSQTGNTTPAGPERDCSRTVDATNETGKTAERDQRQPQVESGPAGESEGTDASPAAVHLDQDLKMLQQRQSELAQCILAIDAQEPEQDSQGACFGRLLLNFEMRHDGEPERDIPIGRLPGSRAFFYESGMTIDADGAPNAYHPDNSGLDDLANAGSPGRWEGLAKDADGEPIIQGANDPTRYVDASKIPFVVLPGGMARQLGARPGDFAIVFNQRNGKSSYAIFGDVGPYDRIGEGSVALAENLGIRSDARNGGTRRGILYLIFPGSGNGRPRTIEEINEEGQKLIQNWEASISPNACAVRQPARAVEGSQTIN
jgi:hypothetical protein